MSVQLTACVIPMFEVRLGYDYPTSRLKPRCWFFGVICGRWEKEREIPVFISILRKFSNFEYYKFTTKLINKLNRHAHRHCGPTKCFVFRLNVGWTHSWIYIPGHVYRAYDYLGLFEILFITYYVHIEWQHFTTSQKHPSEPSEQC